MLSDKTARADDIGKAVAQIVLAVTKRLKIDSPSLTSNLCGLFSRKGDLAIPASLPTVDTADKAQQMQEEDKSGKTDTLDVMDVEIPVMSARRSPRKRKAVTLTGSKMRTLGLSSGDANRKINA